MNKKLIAVAVAGTFAAPAVYADITPYGRVNNVIEFSDAGDEDTVDLTGVASRFGFRGTGDIGNGLTAVGRYEFFVDSDREADSDGSGVNDVRLAYVGIQGGFGTITMGNQWSAFFNTVGTYNSPTYSLGGDLYIGPFRASNTIKYNGSFGPVTVEIDGRLNDSHEGNDVAEGLNGNGFGAGVSIAPTDNIAFGVAFDTEENFDEEAQVGTEDTDRLGFGGSFGFGNWTLSGGYEKVEIGDSQVDEVFVYFGGGFGKLSFLVGLDQQDTDTTEPTQIFGGVYYNIGGGLRLWGETSSVDNDDGSDDTNRTMIGMRIDF